MSWLCDLIKVKYSFSTHILNNLTWHHRHHHLSLGGIEAATKCYFQTSLLYISEETSADISAEQISISELSCPAQL